MKKTGNLFAAAFGLSLFTGVVLADSKETPIKLADCPAAVQKTLTDAAEGGTIVSIDKEEEDNKVTYEADVTIKGKPYEIKVAADGKLISKEIDKDDDHDDKKDEKKEDKKDEKMDEKK